MPRVSNYVKLFCTVGISTACSLAAAELPQSIGPLTNVVQIRNLSASQAAQAVPVNFRGVVTSESSPSGRAVILADETGGVYLLAETNIFSRIRRGDLLEVQGVSDPGEFAPIVKVTNTRRLGRTNIPPPLAVSYQQLLTGALDAQWIEISGVVHRYISATTNSDVWRILIAADGGVVPVRSNAPHDPEVQEDAEVRVRAICLYRFNQRRQVLTPVLELPAGVRVQVVKPAPANPFDAPICSAESLFRFSPLNPAGHRIHARGVVTHAQAGSQIWIRDASSGLRIQTGQNGSLQPGDQIDVLGFPTYGSYSPILDDAVFRKTGVTSPPLPLDLTNAISAFDHEDDLVATEAMLTEVQPVLEGMLFTFDLNGTVFKGILKFPANQLANFNWLPGSKMRVAGICSVIHDDLRPVAGVWHPQAFQLVIRSPADLVVLSAPSWWTPQHTTYVLGTLLAASLLVAGAAMAITRRRLNEQAHRRAMAEAEFAAILTERNRVAREIHDTLAQGLAATSVQLRLAKKHSANDAEQLTHHLDSAQQLVRDSLEEARNSIWNMRSQVLETGDLADALRGILTQMADGSELETGFDVTGRVRRFAPVIENNLLRVGQEAITNAMKHARAKQINVALDFGEKEFYLKVSDDGCGFDPAKPPTSNGGFGLVGMRERARQLSGELNIRSMNNSGTEVCLTVPLSGE
jgi:signal transduction histidine kinase